MQCRQCRLHDPRIRTIPPKPDPTFETLPNAQRIQDIKFSVQVREGIKKPGYLTVRLTVIDPLLNRRLFVIFS